MKVNLLIFGQLVEIVGNDKIELADVKDTDQLVMDMHKQYPALAGSKYLIAVDREVITGNTSLQNNSTVALLPPFSGG